MAQTYQQIRKQIDDLEKQAAQRRQVELSSAIKQVRDVIAKWGLKPEDVFDGLRLPAKSKASKSGRARLAATKYADGKGGTWGGMGKRPRWLSEALAAGAQLSDFLVRDGAADSGATPAAAAPEGKRRAPAGGRAQKKTSKGAASKTTVKPRYSDGLGQTWSGRGLKPRWVKEALASGKTLEDLAI